MGKRYCGYFENTQSNKIIRISFLSDASTIFCIMEHIELREVVNWLWIMGIVF